MRLNDDINEPAIPTVADMELARKMMLRLSSNGARRLEIHIEGMKPDEVQLPEAAAKALIEMLKHMAAGNSVALIPRHQLLSTQEAAELLGVSRPFVVAQMESGQIPHRKVGTHRRVLAADLIEYKRKMDTNRSASLDELAAESQRLGLGY